MTKKNFLLLSMEDEKIKKVSNVISNESCRKILDYLSDRDSTESELAEKLQIPISTVHYNLQQLTETGLIESTEFHYSQKGKEVSHYRLANKYIIIAPKKTFGLKEKLKSIFPVVLIASGAALVLQYLSKSMTDVPEQPMMMAKSLAQESSIAAASAPMAADQAQTASAMAAQNVSSLPQNIALWFFIGALFALAVFLAVKYIRKEQA